MLYITHLEHICTCTHRSKEIINTSLICYDACTYCLHQNSSHEYEIQHNKT